MSVPSFLKIFFLPQQCFSSPIRLLNNNNNNNANNKYNVHIQVKVTFVKWGTKYLLGKWKGHGESVLNGYLKTSPLLKDFIATNSINILIVRTLISTSFELCSRIVYSGINSSEQRVTVEFVVFALTCKRPSFWLFCKPTNWQYGR